jgi:lipid A 1-phosphatase
MWRAVWQQVRASVLVHRRMLAVASLILAACMLYPTEISDYRNDAPLHTAGAGLSQLTGLPVAEVEAGLQQGIDWVEYQGRFLATAMQIIVPVVLADKIGLIELVYVAGAATVATHGLKWALNDFHVGDTQLGLRPNGGQNNMPSGHSAMAGSALGFVWRRYGARHLLYLLPLLLATMAARVLLSAHTVSAVCSGALIGVVISYVMATPYLNLVRRNRG